MKISKNKIFENRSKKKVGNIVTICFSYILLF